MDNKTEEGCEWNDERLRRIFYDYKIHAKDEFFCRAIVKA
jgi:hypothetical protein